MKELIIIKKLYFLSLIFILLLSTIPSKFIKAQEINDNYIILFKSEINEDIIFDLGGEVLERYENVPAVKVIVQKNRVSELRNSPLIKSVEQDVPFKLNGQITDWGVTKINASKTWEMNSTGKGSKVAVLDSGIARHEDLVISGGVSFVSYTSSYHDDNGHGTHVAGIIGAKNNTIGIVGVAPDVSLYAVKVLDQNGSGFLSDIISGIDWSISNKMDIINLSLGAATHSPALEASVNKAYNNGILVVAAAGNEGHVDGIGDTVAYPAKYSSTIAVAATDISNVRGNFSATGNTIEFSAPGVNILSSSLQNKYAVSSGTSMAAGFVSGTLALLKEMYPNLSHQQIREKLRQHVIDLGQPGKDSFYGYGLINSPVGPERISGKDRFEVAVNVSKKGWETSNTVFLTNYIAFADALSATPLAKKYDAPILLTMQNKLTEATKSEILRLRSRNIVIVGGVGSISDHVVTELRNMNLQVRRIDGRDRFEVSANIANEIGESSTVIVANGLNFPDALAIAPYAASNGYPILITQKDRLPSVVAETINRREYQNSVVVGGEASVGKGIHDKLPNPIRIGGKDRFEVAVNILNTFYPMNQKVYIATGLTFADALTGSVLMSKENTTLLLTRRDSLPNPTIDGINNNNVKEFTILGGTGSVSNNVLYNLLR